jgi:hypothetical protein
VIEIRTSRARKLIRHLAAACCAVSPADPSSDPHARVLMSLFICAWDFIDRCGIRRRVLLRPLRSLGVSSARGARKTSGRSALSSSACTRPSTPRRRWSSDFPYRWCVRQLEREIISEAFRTQAVRGSEGSRPGVNSSECGRWRRRGSLAVLSAQSPQGLGSDGSANAAIEDDDLPESGNPRRRQRSSCCP